MFQELANKMEIIGANTNVKVFAVSVCDRYFYPYALGHSGYVTDRHRNACYELIVDSDKNNLAVDNADVIEKAIEINADSVIPKDYVSKPYETHESVKEFISLYQESECQAQPYIVLQPPYKDIYTEFKDFYSQFNHFALGGLQSLSSPEMQVQEINRFHQVAHNDVTVHGFGVGTSVEIIRTCRNNRDFLDSLDIGTPELSIKNDNIIDAEMEQFDFRVPKGDKSSTIRGQFAEAMLYLLNYVLSPLPNEGFIEEFYGYETVEEAMTEQGELSQFTDETTARNVFS
jgi:hypothetical protein